MNILKYSREIKRIEEFEQSLISYYLQANSYKKPTLEQMIELKALRERVNLLSAEVEEYVHKVGISTKIPPSEFSKFIGQDKEIDLFENRFDFNPASQPPVFATDILEKAIGKYRSLQQTFRKQLFNPIIWIREFIRIPFHIISFAGFNANRVEFSWLGKLYKLMLGIFGFLASCQAVMKGVLDIDLFVLIKNLFP